MFFNFLRFYSILTAVKGFALNIICCHDITTCQVKVRLLVREMYACSLDSYICITVIFKSYFSLIIYLISILIYYLLALKYLRKVINNISMRAKIHKREPFRFAFVLLKTKREYEVEGTLLLCRCSKV